MAPRLTVRIDPYMNHAFTYNPALIAPTQTYQPIKAEIYPTKFDDIKDKDLNKIMVLIEAFYFLQLHSHFTSEGQSFTSFI